MFSIVLLLLRHPMALRLAEVIMQRLVLQGLYPQNLFVQVFPSIGICLRQGHGHRIGLWASAAEGMEFARRAPGVDLKRRVSGFPKDHLFRPLEF